jgi:type I restriction enzyme M protein
MTDSSIISKIWNLANVVRDDGVGYGDYLEQITYLLFLKMADEQNKRLCRIYMRNSRFTF